jgi:hypothetical protein
MFPKKKSQARHTSCLKANTEQASEHDEKQDHVGSERGDNIVLAAVRVEHGTDALFRCPYGTELRLDKPRKSKWSKSITHRHDTWHQTTYIRHSVPGHQQDRLTMDEESNVDRPNTHCDHNNNLVSVPNSEPGSTHERLASGR